MAEKNSASFEKSYNELTGKFNQVQAERKKAVDDLKELEKEAEKLRKLTEAQRKQLDDEMLGRVEAENQLQSAREELSLRDQVNNQKFRPKVGVGGAHISWFNIKEWQKIMQMCSLMQVDSKNS